MKNSAEKLIVELVALVQECYDNIEYQHEIIVGFDWIPKARKALAKAKRMVRP